MSGHVDNLPLIGRDTLIELDMMILEPIGNLKETKELRIKWMNEMNELKFTKELIGENEKEFQGIGKHKERKTGKVIKIGF